MKVLCLGALLSSGATAIDDLKRARAKVPRMEYRSDIPHDIGQKLNAHLRRSHPNVKPCYQWSSADLQELQASLHARVEDAHNAIYQETSDNRALRFRSLQEHQAHWAEMNQLVKGHRLLTEMQRDGHCHDAVMWWVHHLSESSRSQLSNVTIPSLPLVEWREPIAEEGPAAERLYKAHYSPSSTCLACHGGGLPWQNPDNEPPPLPRQVNGKDRQRRCDEYFSKDVGECGPCDGIAGAYWGDLPDYGIYPDCEVVAKPEDVPESNRSTREWPKAFAVEMRGADRWPRASASRNKSCNYTTDCSPYNKDAEGQPLPPSVPFHWYAQIHGLLYVDHNDGQFGGGRLRHETVYQFPSGQEGAETNLKWQNGNKNLHLTEIHVQTPEMGAKANPGVMLNLEHDDWSATDNITDPRVASEWRRIPSSDGTCVCVPDPAGLPYFHEAYKNGTYKGRVKFVPPWQLTGSYGPPDGKPVVADHYVKWTFHMFVNVETQKPVMFSSPYGGCATYGNWSTPDELWPESTNGGWRTNPPRDGCSDVTGNPTCTPYVKPKTESLVV